MQHENEDKDISHSVKGLYMKKLCSKLGNPQIFNINNHIFQQFILNQENSIYSALLSVYRVSHLVLIMISAIAHLLVTKLTMSFCIMATE
mgnify:CR=1 FL=1